MYFFLLLQLSTDFDVQKDASECFAFRPFAKGQQVKHTDEPGLEITGFPGHPKRVTETQIFEQGIRP